MNLKQIEYEGVDRIHLSQGSYEHSDEPLGSIKGWEFIDQLSDD
jgi:hypothetical protein